MAVGVLALVASAASSLSSASRIAGSSASPSSWSWPRRCSRPCTSRCANWPSTDRDAAFAVRACARRRARNDDLTQRRRLVRRVEERLALLRREREHVGLLVLAPIEAVEVAHGVASASTSSTSTSGATFCDRARGARCGAAHRRGRRPRMPGKNVTATHRATGDGYCAKTAAASLAACSSGDGTTPTKMMPAARPPAPA